MARIAIVSTILGYPWGGADALWTEAAERAAERGDVLLLAVSDLVAPAPRVRALTARGARLLVRPNSSRGLARAARARRRLRAALGRPDPLLAAVRSFGPDRVLFSGGGTYDPILEQPLCAWLRASRVPYRVVANFQTEHPGLPEPERRLIRDILADAERLFFVSQRNLEITRRHLLHPLPNAECIHGCAVYNPILPAAVPAWPEAHPWTLASVGRLEPVKGIDLLIQAAALALGGERGWRLSIYGKGPDRDYLGEIAERLRLADRVAFPGFVPDLEEVWRTNQLLVCSALDEGVPMTIPEAMLRGRPVLATQVGAAEEWIVPGETGFLCPAPTVELLAESLRQAWTARERWRAMGAAAEARSRKLYRPNDSRRILA